MTSRNRDDRSSSRGSSALALLRRSVDVKELAGGEEDPGQAVPCVALGGDGRGIANEADRPIGLFGLREASPGEFETARDAIGGVLPRGNHASREALGALEHER